MKSPKQYFPEEGSHEVMQHQVEPELQTMGQLSQYCSDQVRLAEKAGTVNLSV
jgi:hypothetical protein